LIVDNTLATPIF
jgi:cystathionine beta-lyase/cystathionine gamma-synthase